MISVDRLPFRILLLTLPFPSFAIVRLGGFGLQLSHVAGVVAFAWLPIFLRERDFIIARDLSIFSICFVLLLGVSYLWSQMSGLVPYLPFTNPSEAGQLLYWVVAVVFMLIGNEYSVHIEDDRSLYRDWQWFAAGAVVSITIGLVEYASHIPAVPFPYGLIYSNPSFAHNWTSVIAGFDRLTATFPEPSMFALYLSITLGVLYGFKSRLLLVVVGAAMVMTLSTSAVIGMSAFVLFVVLTSPRANIRTIAPIATIAVACVTVVAFLIPEVATLLSEITVEKVDSNSFAERFGTMTDGFRAWLASPILGWGLGSARTLDGVTMVLVNFGAVGAVMLGGLFVQSVRYGERNRVLNGFRMSVLTGIVVHSVSNPDWTFPFLWIVIGTLWGVASNESSMWGLPSVSV